MVVLFKVLSNAKSEKKNSGFKKAKTFDEEVKLKDKMCSSRIITTIIWPEEPEKNTTR